MPVVLWRHYISHAKLAQGRRGKISAVPASWLQDLQISSASRREIKRKEERNRKAIKNAENLNWPKYQGLCETVIGGWHRVMPIVPSFKRHQSAYPYAGGINGNLLIFIARRWLARKSSTSAQSRK